MKILWAPIVDSVFVARFGRRKSWLVPVQYFIGQYKVLPALSSTGFFISLWKARLNVFLYSACSQNELSDVQPGSRGSAITKGFVFSLCVAAPATPAYFVSATNAAQGLHIGIVLRSVNSVEGPASLVTRDVRRSHHAHLLPVRHQSARRLRPGKHPYIAPLEADLYKLKKWRSGKIDIDVKAKPFSRQQATILQ